MDRLRPLFLQLSHEDRKAAVEALIFASEVPLTIEAMFKILIIGNNIHSIIDNSALKNGNGSSDDSFLNPSLDSEFDYEQEAVNKWEFASSAFIDIITEINFDLQKTNRPYQIIKAANGYQFCTRREYGELINNLVKTKTKRRFSNAALECLAIIAYRQPITKPEIDQIRGVNSNEVVNSLLEKDLIMQVAQKETIGKPWMYGTTDEFLKAFGLNSLEELPKLKDLDEVMELLSAGQSEDDIILDVSQTTDTENELSESISEPVEPVESVESIESIESSENSFTQNDSELID